MKIKRWAVAILAISVAGLTVSVSPSHGPASGAALSPLAAPTEGDAQSAYEAVELLLGVRRAGELPFLATWQEDDLLRLAVWLRTGLTFEGPWASEELADVLDILDQCADTLGRERFAALLDLAVWKRSDGRHQHLRIVREAGADLPAAAWYARSSRIVLKDALWDDEFVDRHYSWSFLSSAYTLPSPQTPTRHVIIGHEIGHVIIDGLRAEAAALGHGGVSVEGLYSRVVSAEERPHFTSSANEHLASEIAVWALGIGRVGSIETFRAEVLVPGRSAEGWEAVIADVEIGPAGR